MKFTNTDRLKFELYFLMDWQMTWQLSLSDQMEWQSLITRVNTQTTPIPYTIKQELRK
jgi:hypothetical protein